MGNTHIFISYIADLITNCDSELLTNVTNELFSDEALLSELEDPIPMDVMDGENFNFLNINNSEEFKDFKDPAILKHTNVQNANVLVAQQTATDNSQPVAYVQQQDIASPQPNRQQRISVASTTPTVFSSQYAISQNVNFNVQSPNVVTLAPVAQQQLLLPAKLIKSESLVYSKGAQTITSTPVQHQIHTLVNTANGTVLTTGKEK